LRLAELKVEVGESVRKGQVLARFADETVQADLAQARAGLAEAEASAGEATANAQRARSLGDTGVLSAQQMQQYLTSEQTALARAAAQKAAVQSQALRLAQTQVLAPDDGLISARSATLGAVAVSGQELFRLIRGGRLEWRAEVAAADLARLHPGQAATITNASGQTVAGKVRKLGPTVDPQTRNALVYVDLMPARGADVRAGMFARGEFRFDPHTALTLPASVLLLRDGFQCVMVVAANGRVKQTRVKLLARQGDRVAIEGLPAEVRVVERGAAFLSDGDLVKVVPAGF
jgi:RND family efflux transporter MFP subunit